MTSRFSALFSSACFVKLNEPVSTIWSSITRRPIQKLDEITRAVLLCLPTSEELKGLVRRFRKSRSTIQNQKDRLARLIKAHLGADILRQVQEQPGWHNDMHV